MPFCSQCGKQVSTGDVFCGKCGARQPVEPPPPAADPLGNLPPRTAAILCYIPVVGWIASIIVLASHRFRTNRAVRFHAFQGLYLFVAFLIVDRVIRPLLRMTTPGFHLDDILNAVLIGVAIFMMIKASHEEVYSLPVIGELAERSVSEQ